VVAQMVEVVRQEGYIPLLLCQYATLVLPAAEAARLDIDGYAVPLNRDWSWFSLDVCVDVVKSTQKPVVAFMPLASGGLRKDVRGALEWLYADVGVESILYGTATPEHAFQTTRTALQVRAEVDIR